jgi:hypothetical protein
MTRPIPDAGSYGLHRPTMIDARQAMHRVHAHAGPTQWTSLLERTGLTGDETDEPALLRLVEAMYVLDPVSRMCAQALRIRLTAHTHLTAAQSMTRSHA